VMSHLWPTAELDVAVTAASFNATDKVTWHNTWTDWSRSDTSVCLTPKQVNAII